MHHNAINMKKIIIKKNGGFTLIEIMVAVTIFALVMMIAIGAVLAIVSANKKAESLSSVVNNLNFAFEGMVRDIRTGSLYDCGGSNSSSPPTPTDCSSLGSSQISFQSSQFLSPTFYALSTDAQGNSRIGKAVNGGTVSYLTAPEVKIDSLKFYVVGSSNADQIQPHILVVLKGHYGESVSDKSTFNLQTLISQRKLDI